MSENKTPETVKSPVKSRGRPKKSDEDKKLDKMKRDEEKKALKETLKKTIMKEALEQESKKNNKKEVMKEKPEKPEKQKASTSTKNNSVSGKKPEVVNKWLSHLKKVRSENPGMRLGDCMKKAKDSYKK